MKVAGTPTCSATTNPMAMLHLAGVRGHASPRCSGLCHSGPRHAGVLTVYRPTERAASSTAAQPPGPSCLFERLLVRSSRAGRRPSRPPDSAESAWALPRFGLLSPRSPQHSSDSPCVHMRHDDQSPSASSSATDLERVRENRRELRRWPARAGLGRPAGAGAAEPSWPPLFIHALETAERELTEHLATAGYRHLPH